MLTKGQIRNKILLRLRAQKEEERNRKSRIIKEKLFRGSVFRKAKAVMFYISFDGEVNTKEMIKEAQNLGKIVAVPVCTKNRIIRPSRLGKRGGFKKGPYRVYEPAIKRFISLEDLDFVIVPGVAFDKEGNRLGRGKGYYDRFLKQLSNRTTTVGLAFDFQILPSIPATTRDVGIQKVIFA
ncbi:MAG: 5-formyltetrahydrofolate cyclo-ligase [Candidatus Omnitrophica bacterium]|nr:5-formyltetrahydrofolate cyclo-ligase [Candidatus Omnitrophota bacterium]MBU4473010.1 5-formyltetrahydrofolate cyclo-ligase [Candidatus Omnitrophota bacterium]MCG2706133.1 5-formyltetrahydrofolate cyclo-ligase [Candidatus Omnitrophota bacterium]